MDTYSPSNSVTLERAMLWQYEKATRLAAYIEAQQEFFDTSVTAFWDDYRDNIFNLGTADSFGLNVWGKIIGIDRPSYTDDSETVDFSDTEYRTLLKATIINMNMNRSMSDINDYMTFLFPGKAISIEDNLDMTISYIFEYTPTNAELALIDIDGVLPRPAGVEAVVELWTVTSETFGFAGQRLGQLDNAVFAVES